MANVRLITDVSDSFGPNNTHTFQFGNGGSLSWFTTEVSAQKTFRVGGTLSKLFVNIIFNSLSTATTTWRTRKNTANGNQ